MNNHKGKKKVTGRRTLSFFFAVIFAVQTIMGATAFAAEPKEEPVQQAGEQTEEEAGRGQDAKEEGQQPGGQTQEDAKEQQPDGKTEAQADTAKEQNPGETEEALAGGQQPRGPADLTANEKALVRTLERIVYTADEGQERVVKGDGNQVYDMSAWSRDTLKGLRMELGFDFSGKGEEKLLSGDTFTYVLPQTQFVLEECAEPMEVTVCDKETYRRTGAKEGGSPIGSYTIKDNTVTVTLKESAQNMEADTLFGVITVLASAKEDGAERQELTWHNGGTMTWILPARQEEQAAGADEEEASKVQSADAKKESQAAGETIALQPQSGQSIGAGGIQDTTEREKPSGFFTRAKNFLGRLFGIRAASKGSTGDFPRVSIDEYQLHAEEGGLLTSGTMTVASNKDGYEKDDSNRSIDFQIDLVLSNEYLGNVYDDSFDKVMAADGYAEASAGGNEAWETFLNGLRDEVLPPLTYTLDLNNSDKKWIQLPDGVALVDEPLVDSEGNQLGSYTVNADGLVTFTFNKSIYAAGDVTAGAGFNMVVNNDLLEADKPQDIVWDDELQTITGITHVEGGSSGNPADEPYEVIKSAAASVDTPYIDYTIRVQAPKDKTLNGMTLKDLIPSGLTLVSAKMGDTELVKAGGDTSGFITSEGGKQFFTYTIPEGEGVSTESAVFTIRMAVADYNAYSPGAEFKNTASLYKKEGTEPEATSDEITTKMNFKLLDKEGVQNALDGTRFDWTVDVNTKFSTALSSSYLVDRVCINNQQYDFDSVKINGTPVADILNEDGRITGSVLDKSMAPLSDAELDQLSKNMGNTSADNAKPFYYEYETAPGGAKYGVLVIPFNQYANKKVQVTYQTVLSSGESIIEGGGVPTDLTNDANFYYNKKHSGIIGPPPAPDMVEVKKPDTKQTTIGTKSAGRYDKDTQTLSWQFELNYYQTEIKAMRVEDTLAPAQYDLSTLKIQYVKTTRGAASSVTPGEVEKDTSGGEAPLTYSLNEATGKLVIHMGNLAAAELYHITLSAKLKDAGFLSAQGTDKSFNNSAKINGTIAGKTKEDTVSADKILNNTLIEKSTVGTYDYSAHTLTWRVTVNPNHIPVINMVMTDILPVGNEWNELVSVKQKKVDGTSSDGRISASAAGTGSITFAGSDKFTYAPGTPQGSGGAERATEVFTLNPAAVTTDSYVFTLKTKLTDAYLKGLSPLDKPESGGENSPADYAISCTNDASLSGSVYGTPIVAEADATSPANIGSSVLVKTGKFIPDEGVVEWTIDINKDKLNIADYHIEDNLDLVDTAGVMEIVPGTVNLYEAEVKSDGSVVRRDAALGAVSIETTERKITSADFGEGEKKAFQLVFQTQLVKNCSLKDVKNSVKLIKSGNQSIIEGPESGGDSGSFDLANYVKHTKLPTILLKKTSVNSSSIAIGEIKFELTEGTKGGGDSYTFGDEKKERITADNTGYAVYTRLKTDKVYEVKEDSTSAADNGYVSIDAKYIMLAKDPLDDAAGTPATKETKIMVDGEEKTLLTLYPDVTGGVYADAAHANNTVEIKNTPETAGEITFTKKGEPPKNTSGSPSVLEGIKFKISKDGDPSWKLADVTENTVTSDASGAVTFPRVDAGEYTIKELPSDAANLKYYKAGGEIKAVVAWDEGTKTYTTTLSVKSGQPITLTGSGIAGDPYIVTDSLINGSIKLKKVDVKTNAKDASLEGAIFQLFSSKADALAGTNPLSYTAAYNTATGEYTFKDVPYGNYWLREITPPEGYQKEVTPAVTAITCSVFSVKNGTDYSYDAGTITNERITGMFTLTKKDDSAAHNILEGRTFRLTPTDEVTKAYLPADHTTGYYEAVGDGAGVCSFTNIPWGSYKLTEVEKDASDVFNTEAVQITIDHKEIIEDYTSAPGTFTHTIETDALGFVQNALLKTDLTIQKTVLAEERDDNFFDGDTLDQVQFTVSGADYYGDSFTGVGMTSSDGATTITGIPIGKTGETYTLTEKIEKEGYYKSKSWTFQVVVSGTERKALVTGLTPVAGTDTWGTAELDSTKENTIHVTNRPITGKICFAKKTDAADPVMGLAGQGVEGVKFGLYAVSDKGESATPSYTATSNVSGEVIFDNVVFGQKYVLYETEVPVGYEKPTGTPVERKGYKVAEFSGTNLAMGGTDGETFTFKPNDVENRLLTMTTPMEFKKVNQSGEGLQGITFKLYRRNNAAIGADGAGLTVVPGAAVKSYYPYTPSSSAASGADGTFDLTGLVYGDYVLVEQPNPDAALQDGHKAKAFYFEVRTNEEKDGLTVQNEQMHENYTKATEADGHYTDIGKIDSPSGWLAPEKDSDVYILTNHLKYGYVQLNKVAAKKSASGVLESDGKKLPGTRFEVSQKAADGSKTLYLTLETNANGQFDVTEDGVYTDALDNSVQKRLFYGTYEIKEVAPNPSKLGSYEVKIDSTPVEFTLADATTGSGGTVWIKNGSMAGYNEAGKTSWFGNELVRIAFYKYAEAKETCENVQNLPSDYALPIAGAEFTLYTDEGCTSAVPDKGAAVSGEDGEVKFVISGVKSTTYYIKETKAPSGCKLADTVYKVTSDEHGVWGDVTKADGTALTKQKVVNERYRGTIRIKKVSKEDPSKVLPNSKYGLYKMPEPSKTALTASADSRASVEKLTQVATAYTDASGILTFAGVFSGVNYVVKELAPPNGSQVSEKPISITLKLGADGSVVLDEDKLELGDGTAEILNGEIVWHEPTIKVAFIKQNTEKQPLAGAKLELQTMTGEVLAKWTSATKEYVIFGDDMDGKLAVGGQYKLVETEAPEGYKIAEPVAFTVEAKEVGPDEEFIQKVTMTDEKITAGGTNENGPTGTTNVKTGDTSRIAVYLFILIAAAAVIIAGAMWKRKHKK